MSTERDCCDGNVLHSPCHFLFNMNFLNWFNCGQFPSIMDSFLMTLLYILRSIWWRTFWWRWRLHHRDTSRHQPRFGSGSRVWAQSGSGSFRLTGSYYVSILQGLCPGYSAQQRWCFGTTESSTSTESPTSGGLPTTTEESTSTEAPVTSTTAELPMTTESTSTTEILITKKQPKHPACLPGTRYDAVFGDEKLTYFRRSVLDS